MNAQSHTELFVAAVGGHIESFGELCRRQYAAMTAVAYSVLGDHQLAEDAAQESFARALTRLRRLRDPEKFAPWLAAICRNVARDMLAARMRQVNIESRPNSADACGDDCDRELVMQAVGLLAEGEKEVVVLKYYSGLSYERISATLGISRPAVNGRLTRAKKKLVKQLRRMGFREKTS